MTFMLTDLMLYAMWVVLGLMGLDFLFGLYKTLKSKALPDKLVLGYLKDLLMYVLPLLLLVGLFPLDHTDWLLKTGYYVGAVGVILHYLSELRSKL